MRPSTIRALRAAAIGLVLVACTSDRIVAPTMSLKPGAAGPQFVTGAAMPSVRIAEFHYDNPGTDANEKIEISGPAGTDLAGWQIVRYNGAVPAAGATYTSPAGPAITGVIQQSCGTRGVLVFSYPQDGLQNGGNDGFALVNPGGQVVEFLSYEGVMTASNGPAVGLVSTDVGVSETGAVSAPAVSSLQRQPDGSWLFSGGSNSFGTCNDDNGNVTPPPAVASIVVAPASATVVQGTTQQFTATAFDASSQPIPNTTFTWASSVTGVATINASGLATSTGAGDTQITATSGTIVGTASLHVDAPPPTTVPNIRFSEIHYDNGGTDAGEAIEVEGPSGTDITGWSIALYDGNGGALYNTTALNGVLQGTCNTRGVVSVNIAGIQNGSPDGFALIDKNGAVVEFLSYEGAFTAVDGPAAGVHSTDIGVAEAGTENPGLSLQRSADGATWSTPTASTFGNVNACGGPPPPPPLTVTFSGRSPTADPPLPIGFEAQVFATEKNGSATVATTFVWSSETPAIASVDQNGVLRALSAGTAVLRATATDGTTATYSLPTVVAQQSGAPYGGNTEFGDPVDNNPSDDFIIRRAEYTSSFNKNLGRPNWVSAKLDATDYGVQDRCNCFTFDPELVAAGFAPYTTADYTGAGAFAGFGIDRGHLTRSADRTASDLDNARTFYFSNVMPQVAAVNQVTWATLETVLGNMAKQGSEVYVIDGGSGSRGSVKGEGKIDIPAYNWKVAVIMAPGKGLADVHSPADLQVIAVVIPNDPNVNPDWTVYKTTVDSVEALSGYDLLSLLPDNIERAVESNDQAPVAAIAGASSGNEGASLAFDASGSSDPDVGDALTYSWSFGDGTTASGVNASHAFADNGAFTVMVTVTDSHGVATQASMQVTISNVAPTATLSAPAPVIEGGAFTLSLASVVEPSTVDAAALVYAYDCGDGAGFVTSSSPSHSCATTDNGTRSAHARVSDKDGGSNTYDATVDVTNAPPTGALAAPASVVEGSDITLSVTGASDPSSVDAASLTYAFDCGTGAGFAAASASTSAVCATTDNGVRNVRVQITDKDGATFVASSSVTITNAAPIIVALTTPSAPVAAHSSVPASVSFSDAGSGDTHTVSFAWGDGTTTTVNAGTALSAGSSHTYAAAGFQTITVTVTDDDGASVTTSSSQLVVFDPAAGSVKGKGAIPDMSASNDKGAEFDFDAAYNGPIMDGKFDLKRDDAFHVSGRVVDYLVINGARVTMRGSGALEDGTQVDFFVSGIDGKAAGSNDDFIRIKIWNKATGSVLYDTEPGVPDLASPATQVKSGSIKIK